MIDSITTYKPRFVVYYDDKVAGCIIPYTGLMENYDAFKQDVKTARFVTIEGTGLNTYYIMKFAPLEQNDEALLAILNMNMPVSERVLYRNMWRDGKISSAKDFMEMIGEKKRTTAVEFFGGKNFFDNMRGE